MTVIMIWTSDLHIGQLDYAGSINIKIKIEFFLNTKFISIVFSALRIQIFYQINGELGNVKQGSNDASVRKRATNFSTNSN